ncbi:hypothetical protein Bhyg_13179 [Pseudolycoriella hygida]|uniref:Prisilkin-39 n=1 Tax=Pseudolycoriella hygida TaxID=35572 RepID=A0A9Q0MPK4_9DIPT|nr:hypothetical protein Bhyg_13179 [Pseudolycoriella hygida]
MKNLLIFQALFLLFVTMATAVEMEYDGNSIEKKQEKRGISGLAYSNGTPGFGYDSSIVGGYSGYSNGGVVTPISYSRVHHTTGDYGGYGGLTPHLGYLGYNNGYNSLYNGGYNGIYNRGYNGGYNGGYYGIYNRAGFGYSGLGSGYSNFGSGYNTFGNGYSGLGYSGATGYSSVYPYSRVAGLVGSSPYSTGYASNGGYVY